MAMSSMEVVQDALVAPGCCVFTSTSSGPMVDLGQQVAHHGRGYISLALAGKIAAAIGAVDPLRMAELEAENVLLRQRLDELADGEDSIYAKYDRLRASLGELMQHGMMVDKRGVIRYRTIVNANSRREG